MSTTNPPVLATQPSAHRRSATLDRTTFETSRALEYFSEKELRAQIGFGPDYWPIAILRELIDNALDAAEGAGLAPAIKITTDDDCITVRDNGPGIPVETIKKSLDYRIRVSNKAYYVSPTRGQMGNALKVIWAAPFVSTGASVVEITTNGEVHRVEITVDRIAQQPQFSYGVVKTAGLPNCESTRSVEREARVSYNCPTAGDVVKTGTCVKIHWPESTRLLRKPNRDSYNSPLPALDLVATFAVFNPHARFTVDGLTLEPAATDWPKWRPDQPTSAHWYATETLRDLIAAYITKDGATARTVREFVAEFRGLAGTAKQKLVSSKWSGKRLHEFVANGDVDRDFVTELLSRMQAESRPVPAQALGRIGEQHLRDCMVASGVAGESIRNVHKAGSDGLPYVLEVAFGVNTDDRSIRRIVAGLNWSPVIGGGDIDPVLRAAIAEARLDYNDPVTLVIHIARPRFQFSDRGKTRIELPVDLQAAITVAMKTVTKQWKQAKRMADRNDRVSNARLQRLRYKPPRVSIRKVAFEVMEDAYNKASANGQFLAHARQVMYAARPAILARADATEFNDVYFTQTLLKDYIEQFNPNWRVVWDARGHLIEPHTGATISLGGVGVDAYTRGWHAEITRSAPIIDRRVDTHGPGNRYRNVLFIEKEGFTEILQHAGIGTRYDMALMSTKGLPVKAACDLINSMTRRGVRVFVLHDFDLDGFKILRTLKIGTRLARGSPVIDLGLRMADLSGLQSERVSYGQKRSPVHYLRRCGATEEEAEFLVSGGGAGGWTGERVEINAMPSGQLILWLEAKFAEHGVEKVVPDEITLGEAYQRAVFRRELQARIDQFGTGGFQASTPRDMSARVRKMLRKNPSMSWDVAVWSLASGSAGDE